MNNMGHDDYLEDRSRAERRIAALLSANTSLEQAASALSRVVADERLAREKLEREAHLHYQERVRMMRNRVGLMKLARSLGATSDQIMEALGATREEDAQ